MKLLRCDFDDGVPRPEVRYDDSIIDLTQTDLPGSGDDTFGAALERIAERGESSLVDSVNSAPESASSAPSTVTVVEPVASSGRFFALGGAYTQHLRERGQSLVKMPSQWVVPKTAIVGPDEPIVIPDCVQESVMPAVELCIVIGKGGRYISEHNAMDHVTRYTVSNDITARTDWPSPMAYKLIDTFSPCGPSITPKDAADATSLEMTLHQDGACICRGSSESMRFSIPFLVTFLSSVLELRPSDIISTGDPGRVEAELAVGTTISASIENIGTLENPVTSPE